MVEAKKLAAATESARLKVLSEKSAAAEKAHCDALARETELRLKHFGR